MAVYLKILPALATAVAVMFALFGTVSGGSIADIEHVVLFMQENRAFDHYFGTMAGVRGFSDPNVQVNRGIPVWQQQVDPALVSNTSYLLPWYLNYLGGSYPEATQCMVAGSNGWKENHAAINGDRNDRWVTNNTPSSWGYYERNDIPVQFSIADGWTVGNMYQASSITRIESVIASTNPNRVTWVSGSINVPGSPQNEDQGGNPYIGNNETPGCDEGGFNCYPISWKTTAELYEEAGISWSVFQDTDNFDDNPLAWFSQFQKALPGSALHSKAMVGNSLHEFYAQAANGSLPAVSYIVGPAELSEHPPFSPRDGAWLQKNIVDAVTRGAGYSKTVLIISYDESGGWGDHVAPYHSPPGTPGEWLQDPYQQVGYTYSGPGVRLPFYIISPWTRGGAVFTEHADHNSQILFIEEWLAAKGRGVITNEMVPWRRQHMSSLVNAFDFNYPDFSLPDIPDAPAPHRNPGGIYDGSSHCESLYSDIQPPPPYGSQFDPSEVNTLSEQGFKPLRGALTEGRYLVLERDGFAITNTGMPSRDFTASQATAKHDNVSQRWVIHSVEDGGTSFRISSAVDGRYIGGHTGLVDSYTEADNYTVSFAAGKGYSLQKENGKYVSIDATGGVQITSEAAYFLVFSVTYS